MKLKLKNIGTLKQAEIDLTKDLIILAGPNNTGKTYAAYTVYGVCETLRKMSLGLILSYDIPQFVRRENDMSVDIIKFLDIFLHSLSSFVDGQNSQSLVNIFATDTSHFMNSEVSIIMDKNALENYLFELDFEKELTKKGFEQSFLLSKSSKDKFCRLQGSPNNEWDESMEFDGLEKLVTDFLLNIIVDFHFNKIYINTAERSAINIFSKELSIKRNSIVEELLELRDSKNGDANKILKKLQRYPLPIRDSLAIAEDLANLSRNKSNYGFLADRIEEVLLDGKITTSKEGEVQYTPSRSKTKNLSIHLTASIVKSLSNLVFYFRHLAQKGDFIIIDEPELNLHPDNQRKVARLIGEIINNGFKVMISTHSDYIIRELNNLIMLKTGGDTSNYLIEKYGYDKKQLIDYTKVGAYLFKNNRNYNIEVTETGFEVNTIDEEINNLNNASEEIFFTLFD